MTNLATNHGQPNGLDVDITHFVTGTRLMGPYPKGTEAIYFGMGCFWGAERLFWDVPGVYVTAVGYQGGATSDPNYRQVCAGETGHAEIVMVVYDPAIVMLDDLLKIFWEAHNPTQGMRQGNDVGSQYRSAIYTSTDEQATKATASKAGYAVALAAAGQGPITTEIAMAAPFYFAEDYHQQYLAKNPDGYCGLNGTGVSCRGTVD